MKTFLKVLKYLGFALLGLLAALIIMPFVFKPKIVAALQQVINEQVNAEVSFRDIDLSFIKSFPSVKLSIDSLKVIGVDDYDGITLYKAVTTSIDLDFWSLTGDNPAPIINAISLTSPEINVIIDSPTKANYLISKDSSKSTEPAKFTLALKSYNVTDGTLTYDDRTMQFQTALSGIDHSGKGDFTQDIFDLVTMTSVEDAMVKYEGMRYLNKAKINLDSKINLDFVQNKFAFNDNIVKLNELDLTGSGSVQFQGEDMIIDASFKSRSEDFKSILSLVPSAYTADFKDVKTEGKASIKGIIKGIYNGLTPSLPGFDVSVNVENGFVKYPTLAQSINNVNAAINIKAARSDYKDMVVNIPNFRLKIDNDQIEGKIFASNLSADQRVEGMIKGKLNLESLKSAFPMEGLETMKGKIDCDLSFKAKMSDVDNERYENIAFSGNATGVGIVYKSTGMPLVTIPNATASASPKEINFAASDMKLGKSDLTINAKIGNPLAMFSANKEMVIDLNGSSKLMNLNEWMPAESAAKPPSNVSLQSEPIAMSDELLKSSQLKVKYQAGEVIMNKYKIDNFLVNGRVLANAIDVDALSGTIKDNDFALTGSILNAYDYFFSNGVIDGTVDFTSKRFNANDFMTVPDPNVPAAVAEIIPVPERVRMDIRANIANLTYTNLEMSKFKGILAVRDQEVILKETETQMLGGKVGIEGLYSTKDITKPDFSIKLDLAKIQFTKAIASIDLLKKVAPIAEYIDGFFNTTLVMQGTLGKEMTPDLNTLSMSGFIETLNSALAGFEPLSKLGDKLGLSEIKNLNLDNTKNWFEVVDGFMELKETNKVIKGIDITASGKHGLGKEMDYNFDMIIPRAMLKKNSLTAKAETGLSMLENEASKIGLNISQGPNLFVNVKMTGSIRNPQFKITPKPTAGGAFKDVAENAINDAAQKAKDSITNVFNTKKQELKDTVTNRVNKEIDKAKTKAQDAANKAMDSLKNKMKEEANMRLDSLAKKVISDSLKQKAKDVINKETNGGVDKIKDKIKDFNPFKKKGN